MKIDKYLNITISIPYDRFMQIRGFWEKKTPLIIFIVLSILSIFAFIWYYQNGLDVAYNDARSHLDIGRRVVDNLTPGFAQLGSVWLPLPHLLMAPLIWNNWMWHSGFAGAIQNMISYVATGLIIYFFLKKLKVGWLGRTLGVLVFALNINILYMQSTAMGELFLLSTMTMGCYELLMWHKDENLFHLIKAAFWIMLSTLIRYDGYFLLLFAIILIGYHSFRKHGYRTAEGVVLLFGTLGGFGVVLWLLWNLLIFKDPLYFALGPFSAHAQQLQLEQAGDLATKKNMWLSFVTYFYSLAYNLGLFQVLMAALGAGLLWFDTRIDKSLRNATIALMAPLAFNVISLYLGFSVLYVQGLNGNSWFNVRYGLMMAPSVAIYLGYLVNRVKPMSWVLVGLFMFVTFFSYANHDAVTISDAVVGESGKNVTQVAGWLGTNVKNENGYVLLSVASHDAIIFSSGLDMKRFIHEGTGQYWYLATKHPEYYARWVVMRTHDTTDLTYKALEYNKGFWQDYALVESFPFADVYELKPQYLSDLRPLPLLAQR